MVPEPLKKFIDLFAKLPGIGPRQASRIAFWLVRQPRETQIAYGKSLEDVSNKIAICKQCFFVFETSADSVSKTTLSEVEGLCHICQDPNRDQSIIAVVEKETDLITIEKTKKFRGVYHVLGTIISPLEKTEENPRVASLAKRIEKSPQPIKEIILALGGTSEGEFSALELERILKPFGIKITRLGRGLPRGAEVEFADEDTISAALEGRR